MYYHYVFNTYKKKYILIDQDIVHFLKTTFYEIAQEKGFKIESLAILGDHVHVLIQHQPMLLSSEVMKMLKGISARKFFKQFNTDRFIYRKLWGRSYYVEEISPEKINCIVDYIKNQTIKGVDKRILRRQVSKS